MTTLTSIELLRLKNLLVLHARPARFGAPTSKSLIEYLDERGVTVAKNTMTGIYQGAQPIAAQFATQIERAFALPAGWLSADHEFIYALTPESMAVHARLSCLSLTVRERIYALVEVLADGQET